MLLFLFSRASLRKLARGYLPPPPSRCGGSIKEALTDRQGVFPMFSAHAGWVNILIHIWFQNCLSQLLMRFFFGFLEFIFAVGTSNNNHIYKEMCIANLSSICEGSKLPHVCIQWTKPAMKGGQHWKAVDTPHHSASKQKIEYLFCLCGTLSKVWWGKHMMLISCLIWYCSLQFGQKFSPLHVLLKKSWSHIISGIALWLEPPHVGSLLLASLCWGALPAICCI